MKIRSYILVWLLFSLISSVVLSQTNQAENPVIHADVPDMSMVRVGDSYYMSSTTMHMSPGVPIMKSTDLINWKLVNYAYDVLDTIDALSWIMARVATDEAPGPVVFAIITKPSMCLRLPALPERRTSIAPMI